MNWCHWRVLRHRGRSRSSRSISAWLCLKLCCLLVCLIDGKNKLAAHWTPQRLLCWGGHGCVERCLDQPASICCKALIRLGEQSRLVCWWPGIMREGRVV